MTRIREVRAREIFDSRGQPTIEVEIVCEDRIYGRAIAPAGASRGGHEAAELRDYQSERFSGKGVLSALRIVHEVIAPALRGAKIETPAYVDHLLVELDGTPNRSRLGGNVLVATSVAVAQAVAKARGLPLYESLARDALECGLCCCGNANESYCLPVPMVNMISGGLHAGQRMEVQDFLIIPRSAQNFRQAMELTFRIHRQLGALLRRYGYEADLVADEGGYGPRLHKSEQALEFLVQAIRECGLQEGKDIVIAIDLAATHFYRDGYYDLATVNQKLSSPEMLDYLAGWLSSYPIVSLEDPLAENDWEGWTAITRRWGHVVQLVGDDLFATNLVRLRDGISRGIANAILIKPNQVGTLTETFEVMRMAQRAGYRMVLSARSGETEESWLADLAVATGVGQIKIGCITRGERLAKYNQLLRIEDWLGDKAQLVRIWN
mgnify:CR=1 FL=1